MSEKIFCPKLLWVVADTWHFREILTEDLVKMQQNETVTPTLSFAEFSANYNEIKRYAAAPLQQILPCRQHTDGG